MIFPCGVSFPEEGTTRFLRCRCDLMGLQPWTPWKPRNKSQKALGTLGGASSTGSTIGSAEPIESTSSWQHQASIVGNFSHIHGIFVGQVTRFPSVDGSETVARFYVAGVSGCASYSQLQRQKQAIEIEGNQSASRRQASKSPANTVDCLQCRRLQRKSSIWWMFM